MTWLGASAWICSAQGHPLVGTAPLTMEGDIASNLVAGADRFLLRKIDESAAVRARFWHKDFSSWQAYAQSLATNRQRLAHILGAGDQRASQVELELIATPSRQPLRGRGQNYEVFDVCWPAFGDVTGEGLLLAPVNRAPVANVVAIPDADQTRVIGWGEGGLAAFCFAVLDTRIKAACVSGYFEDRGQIWRQPVDRNVLGLLEQLGDAEVAMRRAWGFPPVRHRVVHGPAYDSRQGNF